MGRGWTGVPQSCTQRPHTWDHRVGPQQGLPHSGSREGRRLFLRQSWPWPLPSPEKAAGRPCPQPCAADPPDPPRLVRLLRDGGLLRFVGLGRVVT